MKTSKRILSGFLAAAMCISLVPSAYSQGIYGNSSADNQSVADSSSDDTSDLELKPTNSIGYYIKKMQDEQNKRNNVRDELRNYYSVQSVKLSDDKSQIETLSSQNTDCTLKVLVINDDNDTTVMEYSKDVSAGENTETLISVDQNIFPVYYRIEVFLIGIFGKRLSDSMVDNTHTHYYCEAQKANINDYDEDNVINLDDDDETNFIVLNEGTVCAKSSDSNNILISADYEKGEYKFENADEDILNLKKDDYFCIKPNNFDFIAINVESVNTKNGVTTITDSESSALLVDKNLI